MRLGVALGSGGGGGGYTDPLTTNGDTVVRSGGVTTRLAVGSEGQVHVVASGAPAWGFDLGFYGLKSGYAIQRNGPSSAVVAFGAATSTRSGTTYAVGTKSAFGVTLNASTTLTTVCGTAATTFDVDMTQHAFGAVAGFSGIVGSSGRRFFAGVTRDSNTFTTCEVLTGDAPTEPSIGFFVRGASDTTFRLIVSDNSTTELTDTGVTATNGSLYLFYYDIRESDLRVRWRIFSATDAGTPALLGSGTFTTAANPFGSTGSVDCGILVATKADSNATYSTTSGDAWAIAGVMP